MNENDDPGKMIRKRDQDTKRRFAHKANKRREDEQAIKSEENNPSSDTAIKKKKKANASVSFVLWSGYRRCRVQPSLAEVAEEIVLESYPYPGVG